MAASYVRAYKTKGIWHFLTSYGSIISIHAKSFALARRKFFDLHR